MIRERIVWIFNTVRDLARMSNDCRASLYRIQQAVARIELRQLSGQDIHSLNATEFQATSQWGEDGIIQYLIRHVPIGRKIFVEFGVGDYTESNTRFLLQNDNWSGLVIDGSPEHITCIKNDPIYWRYNLKAECAFVDRDNINQLISGAGVSGDIGLLSIDIDGNDYWVWQSINCIKPRIVVCEYNSLFGPVAKITVPYNKTFARTNAHYSNLYYGASLSALHTLGREMGYSLIGSNSAGNNAFFVRDDLVGPLKVHVPDEVYVQAQFRESRNIDGKLSYLDFDGGLAEIAEMPVYDLDLQRTITIEDSRKI